MRAQVAWQKKLARRRSLVWVGPLISLGVIAAAALDLGCSRSTAPGASASASAQAPGKRFADAASRGFRKGELVRYSLAASSQLAAGAAEQLLMGIDLKGNWEWTTLAVGASGATLHLQLRDVEVKVQTGQSLHQPSLDKLKAELGQSVFVEVEPSGRVRSVGFTQPSQSFSLRFLETLIDDTELLRSSPPASAWQVEESDTTGRYQADYRRLPSGAYAKHKLRYLSVMGGGVEQPDWSATVKESRADLGIDKGSLAHLDFKEVVSTSVPGALSSASATTSLLLELTTQEPRPESLTQLETARANARPAAALELPEDRSAADQALVQGRTLEALLKDAAGFPAQETAARQSWAGARRALAALFRQSPEAVAVASERAKTKPTEVNAITVELGDAGTPEAQAALCKLARDEHLAQALRNASLQGLARAERPEPSTCDTFEALLDNTPLAEAAALGLGSAARNLRAIDPQRAAHATSVLQKRLDQAHDVTARRLYLSALGNAGAPAALEQLLAGVHATDPTERTAAIMALQSVPGDAAEAALCQAAFEAKTVNERKAAVTALRNRPASAAILKVFAGLARGEKEQSIRVDAIRGLVDLLRTLPAAADELRWVSDNEPNENFRAIAKHALEQH